MSLIGTWLRSVKAGGPSFEGRLRLLLATCLLTLPLAGGVWAFADFAGRNAQDHADAQLAGLLRAALQGYTAELGAAEATATAVASRRDVQLALARTDRRELRRLARATHVVFRPTGGRPVGTLRSGAGTRSVSVEVGDRRVGLVLAQLPLDSTLLRRIRRVAGLSDDWKLALHSGALPPSATVTIAGSQYRAAAGRLVGGSRPTSLLVAEPLERFDAAATRARDRVLLAGLVTLGCVALLGYALAPAIARGRVLRSQRDQAARVLLHLGEGVLFVDDQGMVRLWNPAAETITGLPASSVVGRAAAEALEAWPALRDGVRLDEERPQPAQLAVSLGGRELWLSVTGARFSEGTVYAFRDLTEERKLEQMRSDFVATVSHELRTPLAAIHGSALTLARRGGELEPVLHERLLGIVVEQSERLSELVEQILLAAQLDSGGLQYTLERFDAGELARTVVEAVRPRLPAEVTVELSAPPASTAFGDPGKTRRVLTNLVDNAVKYSPDGGRIRVAVAARGRALRFVVRDEGLGIPPAEQERVFEKFYRLDAAMTRGVGGSGLGLYICRELVEGMGGRIWVRSEPGVGSEFCFELPLAERQLATA